MGGDKGVMTATLVCSSITFTGLLITAIMTYGWTGPSYTVPESLCMLNCLVLIVTTSFLRCCPTRRCVNRKIVVWSARIFFFVGLLSIIVWASAVQRAKHYSCKIKVSCEKVTDCMEGKILNCLFNT